jgi:hypothetical protein
MVGRKSVQRRGLSSAADCTARTRVVGATSGERRPRPTAKRPGLGLIGTLQVAFPIHLRPPPFSLPGRNRSRQNSIHDITSQTGFPKRIAYGGPVRTRGVDRQTETRPESCWQTAGGGNLISETAGTTRVDRLSPLIRRYLADEPYRRLSDAALWARLRDHRDEAAFRVTGTGEHDAAPLPTCVRSAIINAQPWLSTVAVNASRRCESDRFARYGLERRPNHLAPRSCRAAQRRADRPRYVSGCLRVRS